MPIHDDDMPDPPDERDSTNWRWDRDARDDDEIDLRDRAPDDFTTVRCPKCKKLIFEDALRCPYCKHLQLEEERSRKPLWIWITVLLCIGMMGGFGLLAVAFHLFAR
jgi:hypothetical protein